MELESIYRKMSDEEIISRCETSYENSEEELEILKKEVASRKWLNNNESIKRLYTNERKKIENIKVVEELTGEENKAYKLMSDMEILLRYVNIKGYICPNAKEIIKEEIQKRGLDNKEAVRKKIGIFGWRATVLNTYFKSDEKIEFKIGKNIMEVLPSILLLLIGIVAQQLILITIGCFFILIFYNNKIVITSKRIFVKKYNKIEIIRLDTVYKFNLESISRLENELKIFHNKGLAKIKNPSFFKQYFFERKMKEVKNLYISDESILPYEVIKLI